MTDLKDSVRAATVLQDSIPLEEFCGLTRAEIRHLLYNPFGHHSPLRLRADIPNEALDRIPFFRLIEASLAVISREGFIKLTQRGALSRKILRELYSQRFIPEELIEMGIVTLRREMDSPVLFSVRCILELSRLVKKRGGRLYLTRERTSLLTPDKRRNLFERVLQTFTLSFAWSSNDRYTELPAGQFGWGYSVYLLSRFGDEPRPVRFYAEKYLMAFPEVVNFFIPGIYGPPPKECADCYAARVFTRFLGWFGFVPRASPKRSLARLSYPVAATDLVAKVFRFDT